MDSKSWFFSSFGWDERCIYIYIYKELNSENANIRSKRTNFPRNLDIIKVEELRKKNSDE